MLNVCTRELELDTGSLESLLTVEMVRDIRRAKIVRTYQKAKDYGNSVIQFVWETTLNISISNRTKPHTFQISLNNLSPLLGRKLCETYRFCDKMHEELTSIKLVTKEGVFQKFNKFFPQSYKTM